MKVEKIVNKISIKPTDRKIKKVKHAINSIFPTKNKKTIYVKPETTFWDKVKGNVLNFMNNIRKQG